MKINRNRPQHKTLKSILQIAGWLLVFVTCALTIGVKIGLYIAPDKLMAPAYLGLGFPFVLFFIILLLFLFLLFKAYFKVLIEVLFLLILIPQIYVYYPIHIHSEAPSKDAIKILSYNVMAFAYGNHTDQKPHPILKYIRESNADIVCLQEALLRNKEDRITLEKIKANLPQYPFVNHHAVQKGGSYMIILSKFPILEVASLPLDSRFNGAISYTLKIKNKLLRLINVHLESSGITARDGIEYVALAKDGKASELAKKVDFKLQKSFKMRAKQVDRLTVEIDKTTTPYLAIVGDFNDTPISYARYRLSHNNMQDAFVKTGQGAGYSYIFKKIGLRIDHILLSEKIKPYQCRIDNTISASDHYPIETYIELIP